MWLRNSIAWLTIIKIFKIKHKTNRKAGLTCLNKDKEFCICRSYQFVSQLKSRHQLKLFKSYATLGTFKCSTFSCKNRTECVQLSIYMWLMVNSGNNYQKLNKAFCNEDMKTDKPTAKEIPEIGFDGTLSSRNNSFDMQFDLKR